MIRRVLCCGLLGACCLLGQLQILVMDGDTERAAGGTLNLGNVEVFSSVEVICRISNVSNTDVALYMIAVTGSGFALTSSPGLPQSLPPGTFVKASIRFAPVSPGYYSGSLAVNNLTLTLLGQGLPIPTIEIEEGSGLRVLSPGETIDFGSVQYGHSAVRRFALANRSTAPLRVDSAAVSGAMFSGPAGLSLPLEMAPADIALFEVAFQPGTAGPFQGLLQVGRQQFALRGTGLTPPFPKPEILIEPQTSASGQQLTLSVRLPSPSPGSGTGKVQLTFQSAVAGAADDPAVQFLSDGSRTATFSINEGDSVAQFGGDTGIAFQTGTTAGTLVFSVQLGDAAADLTVPIPAAPIAIAAATALRGSAGIEVQVSGFDNSRSASELAFTFFDQAGNPVAPGAIRVNAAADFQRYFASSDLGGVFLLKAAFPVDGAVAQVTGVEIELTNTAGTAHSERIRF